jgi:hypothetical protein
MLTIGEWNAVNLLRFFDDLPDPRSKVNRLGDVIVVAACAVLATADGPTAIASWAKLKAAWLRKHLSLPSGIPGKDTFRRVLGLLTPAVFQQCFQQWLEALRVPSDRASGEKMHIAIDGKTLRRSHDRKNGLEAIPPTSVQEPCGAASAAVRTMPLGRCDCIRNEPAHSTHFPHIWV